MQAGDHLQLPPTIKTLNQKTEKPKAKKERKHAKKKEENLVDEIESLEIDSTEETTPPEPPAVVVDPSSATYTPPPETPNEFTPILDAPPAVLAPIVLPSPSSCLQPSPTLEATLFSRLLALHGPSIRRMLKIQYRMNSKIMAFASAALYDGALIADSSVMNRVLSDLPAVEFDEEIDEPLIFIDSEFI